MNKELDKVTGQVQAVSSRFNGAFKVNDVWYNFSKNCTRPAVENGDTVSLSLEGWEAKGKSGVNVVGCEVLAKAALPKKEEKPSFIKPQAPSTMSKDEWQAKDTRISRQGVIQVAVQVAGSFDKAVELADKMLSYVNEIK